MSGASDGKAARAAVPRSSHGAWTPAADRPDPVDTLLRQDLARTPELVPIRHGRMVRSPFAFFRGAAAIMAADLAATPVTGIRAQLCGDAHLANFGAYAAPDRSLVFDLNDFDETFPGPWEWEVKRLAASVAVCARDRGFDERAGVRDTVRAYREAMREFAAMRTIEVWYARLDVDKEFARWSAHLSAARSRDLDRSLAKARRKDSLRALAKLTVVVDGEPRILSDPPLVVPIADLLGDLAEAQVREMFGVYRREYARTLQNDRRHLLAGYDLVDVAHKVVGVGSVGTKDWIALLLGRDRADPLFLQFKEAQPSVLAPFAGRARGGASANQGRRVVEGQRLMQAASDVFLGWLRVATDADGRSRDYYVRQLWDAKASAPIATMDAGELRAYGEICGWTLARAHARSGDRFAIAGYLGAGDTFEQALADFARSYADQNERDHAALRRAVDAGTVAADLER
ncbi:MAG TPA: DUF2252 domain-containing protein [Solirubrobacteraceae bacterium]|nr:DUF2252 domain-containing protein [Solirubrobacteraceae bacterium]